MTSWFILLGVVVTIGLILGGAWLLVGLGGAMLASGLLALSVLLFVLSRV